MDINNNNVIKEKSSKANIVIIIVAIVVLVAGAFGIWWFSNQDSTVQKEAIVDIVKEEEKLENDIDLVTSESISLEGIDGKTALELLQEMYPGQVETTIDAVGIETVVSISGVRADDTKAWEIYINGAKIAGITGAYQTSAGETIEWKLEQVPAMAL